MRGRLNYIELRVVTQRTYRTERSLGKFIVRPFGYVLILKNRRRSKLRSHPRPARFGTCAPTIFICPTCSLSARELTLIRASFSISFRFRSRDLSYSLSLSVDAASVPDFGWPRFPGGGKICGPRKRRFIISRLTLIVMHS